ncbi:Ada metal-binding domain-containing protein [Mucilaginibacter sp. UR6-11]|uniref:Ada metal-binding domain-containing protein n=1 Tax=Mucilaginibacter sp. UR6-11 TaxID=1435644 RepID=UPI001E5C9D77|nr:Ada metal-binding domain-containing protein [Mucilaginibacter sp. UR6-11]MCC8424001.1 metal-binding protein [Mucilaginibacter sp. UR6-11]
MLNHTDLGAKPFARLRALQLLILNGRIKLGGYKKAKIFGTLACKSGRRMKPDNRVFFKDEQEAIAAGYRPCAHCLNKQFKLWKLQNGTI